MKADFFGEEASLVTLFGDEVAEDIEAVAREVGLPVSTVASLVGKYAPDMLGEDAPAAKGSAFANVFESVARGIGAAAPGIASAIKGGGSTTPAPAAAPAADYMKFLIPAGIGALALIFLLKK